jgi:hypothetical protein
VIESPQALAALAGDSSTQLLVGRSELGFQRGESFGQDFIFFARFQCHVLDHIEFFALDQLKIVENALDLRLNQCVYLLPHALGCTRGIGHKLGKLIKKPRRCGGHGQNSIVFDITMILCGNIQGQSSDIAAEHEQEIDGRFSASSAPWTKKGVRVGDIVQMNLIGMNYKMFRKIPIGLAVGLSGCISRIGRAMERNYCHHRVIHRKKLCTCYEALQEFPIRQWRAQTPGRLLSSLGAIAVTDFVTTISKTFAHIFGLVMQALPIPRNGLQLAVVLPHLRSGDKLLAWFGRFLAEVASLTAS